MKKTTMMFLIALFALLPTALFALPRLSSVVQQPDVPAPLTVQINGISTTELAETGELVIAADVVDGRGQTVRALDVADFRLLGDFAPFGEIVRVENVLDADLPFATVLAFDVSTSMFGSPIEAAKEAARRYVERIGQNNPVALLTFGTNVEIVQPYTTDTSTLLAAIDQLEAGGETALYQGSVDAVTYAETASTPRRAIILLSDGAEYGGRSSVNSADAIAQAQQRGIPVFTIGLGFNINGPYLRALADSTSADYFQLPAPEQLSSIYDDLAARFTSQYLVYVASRAPLDGTVYVAVLEANANDAVAQDSAEFRLPIPVPIVDFPDAPDLLAEATSIRVRIRADQEVTRITTALDDQPVEFSPTDDGLSILLDPLNFPAGSTAGLVVTAEDSDGDVGQGEYRFTVGEVAPIVTIDDIQDGQSIDAATPIRISARSNAPVRALSLRAGDNGAELPADPALAGTFLLDPMTLAPGITMLTAQAALESGTTGSASVTVAIPALPPQILVSGLQNGETIAESRALTFDFITQTPVDQVTVFVDGRDLVHLIRSPFGTTLDVLPLAPGAHTLLIAANNRASMGVLDLSFTVADSVGATQLALTPTATLTPTPLPTSFLPELATEAAALAGQGAVRGQQAATANAAAYTSTYSAAAGQFGGIAETAVSGANAAQAAGDNRAATASALVAAAATGQAVATNDAMATATRAAGDTATQVANDNRAATAAIQATGEAAATNEAATATQVAGDTATQVANDNRAATAAIQATGEAVATNDAAATATRAAGNTATQAASDNRSTTAAIQATGEAVATNDAAATATRAAGNTATQAANDNRSATAAIQATGEVVATNDAAATATRAAGVAVMRTEAVGTRGAATRDALATDSALVRTQTAATLSIRTEVAVTRDAGNTSATEAANAINASQTAAITPTFTPSSTTSPSATTANDMPAIATLAAQLAAQGVAAGAETATAMGAEQAATQQIARTNSVYAVATAQAGVQRLNLTQTLIPASTLAITPSATSLSGTDTIGTDTAGTEVANRDRMNGTATDIAAALQARTQGAATSAAQTAVAADSALTAQAAAATEQAVGQVTAEVTERSAATEAALTPSPVPTLTPVQAAGDSATADTLPYVGLCAILVVVLLFIFLLIRRRSSRRGAGTVTTTRRR